jgi:hypothetical protein
MSDGQEMLSTSGDTGTRDEHGSRPSSDFEGYCLKLVVKVNQAVAEIDKFGMKWRI